MSKVQQKLVAVSKVLKGTNLEAVETVVSRSRPASAVLQSSKVSTKSDEILQPPSPRSSSSIPSSSLRVEPPISQPLVPLLSDIPIRDQNMNLNWPIPADLTKAHFLWKARSTFTIFVVGLWSKSVLSLMNKTRIFNKERMTNAIFNRPEGTSLVTVSNHESCIDDPALIAAFMTIRQLANQKTMRWSLAAYDICYRSKLNGSFFSLGKCPPVIRGGGVYQKAVDFAIERVNSGDWVHIFPEGRVNTEREGLYRLKWGIGRILSECQRPPIVIPFWHTGMSAVLPNRSPYIPRFGNDVLINVGEPIDLTEILKTVEGKSALERRKMVTDYIQEKLRILREETLQATVKIKI